MHTKQLRRFGFLRFGATVIMVGLCGGVSSVAQPMPGDSEIIALPTYRIEADRVLPVPESWRYARLPGFEVISNENDSETKKFLRDFQLLKSAVDLVWPGASDAVGRLPATIVLCGRGDQFGKFAPKGASDEARIGNCFFFNDPHQIAIVLDTRPAQFQMSGKSYVSDPYQAFYQAYFRFLVRRNFPKKMPPWFEQGFVQVLSRLEFNKRSVELGRIKEEDYHSGSDTRIVTEKGDPAETEPTDISQDGLTEVLFTTLLKRHSLLSMPDLFSGRPQDAEDRKYWSAQCEAFVHMCLYGKGKVYQKPLFKLLSALAHEPMSEGLFKRHFGRSYKQIELELSGYCEIPAHSYVEFSKKKGGDILPEPPPVELREATEAESCRIKGDALRLAGHVNEARYWLIAPYVRGQRDPQLLAALGFNELAAGETVRARKYFEVAFKNGTFNVRALVELARLRFEEEMRKGGELSSTQAATLLAPLDAASKCRPLLPEIYETMARVWLTCKETPTRERLMPLVDGANRFGSPKQAYNAALVFKKFGYLSDARIISDSGMRSAQGDPDLLARFKVLDQELPPSTEKPRK